MTWCDWREIIPVPRTSETKGGQMSVFQSRGLEGNQVNLLNVDVDGEK